MGRRRLHQRIQGRQLLTPSSLCKGRTAAGATLHAARMGCRRRHAEVGLLACATVVMRLEVARRALCRGLEPV
jgi:hypothetical protein